MSALGSWFCMVCDESGQSERFDREAEAHTKATRHGTVTSHRDTFASRQEPQP